MGNLPEPIPDPSREALELVIAGRDLGRERARDLMAAVMAGQVPPTRLGRFYRDALGYANQSIARAADEVLLLVAGLPWRLKTPD